MRALGIHSHTEYHINLWQHAQSSWMPRLDTLVDGSALLLFVHTEITQGPSTVKPHLSTGITALWSHCCPQLVVCCTAADTW